MLETRRSERSIGAITQEVVAMPEMALFIGSGEGVRGRESRSNVRTPGCWW